MNKSMSKATKVAIAAAIIGTSFATGASMTTSNPINVEAKSKVKTFKLNGKLQKSRTVKTTKKNGKKVKKVTNKYWLRTKSGKTYQIIPYSKGPADGYTLSMWKSGKKMNVKVRGNSKSVRVLKFN